MKKRLTAMIVCVLLVLSLLPTTALADAVVPDGYNVHDYTAIRAFLETTVDGVKNGSRVATAYNADDPTTWQVGFVTPTVGGEQYVNSINWLDKGLSGTLDLSNFAELTYIDCRSNSLTGLIVTNDTKLAQIRAENNQLTSLDLSTNTGLSHLYCNDNALKTLDTSKAGSNLVILYCHRNDLTSINVSGNTKIQEFYCSENNIKKLDASNLSVMTTLACDYNALTELILTGCSALTNLYCSTNALTSLSVDGCTNLGGLYCEDNQLTSLDLSKISKVTSLSYKGNANITLNFGTNAISSLNCSNCGYTELDLSALTSLTDLICSGNTLSTLKFGSKIESLDCSNCGLKELDLSAVTALTELICTDNKLPSLDLSKNTLLEELECNGNRLSTLDISKNTILGTLECRDNCISTLDLTHNPDIYDLDIKGNPLKQIDASINGSSISITAKDGGYAELYYSGYGPELYATAVPVGPAAFYNWTNGAAEAATTAKYDLPASTNIDLDVNFLVLKGSLADEKVKCGSSISLTPTIAGGTWAFDSAYLTRSDNVFTAIKPGTTQVSYTVNSKTTTFDITIAQGVAVGLSCTKTDATVYGGSDGSVTINATGGDSGTYEYSLGGAWQKTNIFSGLKADTYTAAVRDAVNYANTASCSVKVDQPSYMGILPAKKIPSKVNAGTAVTLAAPAAPRGYTMVSVTYSSSNPSVASVDSSGNVTFLAGGKASIITKSVYQMTDKKGKIKTKTTTVKKTVTVKQPVASVTLNMADATVMRAQKVKLTAAVSPATASSKKLTWKSSNPKVAAVTSAGVVTGKSAGTAIITCTAKDGSGATVSCTVTVTPIQPTGLKLSKAVLTVKTGKSASLKATVMPKNTDFKTVTFVSSNPSVATVDAKGKVKAIAPGTVTITATSTNGLTASCTVTVK